MLYKSKDSMLSLMHKVEGYNSTNKEKGISNMYFIGVLIFMISWTTLIYFGYIKNI